jgi:acyl-CoA dehydrogenase
VDNLIGEENKGWTYAKYLLGHERTGIAQVGRSKRELEFLKRVAGEQQVGGGSLMQDIRFASKVADLEIELMALEITVLRVVSAESHGKGPGPEASLLKVKGTEIQQRLTELMVEAVGPRALPFHVERFDTPAEGEVIDQLAAYYFNFRKTSIYGGSNEIQKNIMTQMILGL